MLLCYVSIPGRGLMKAGKSIAAVCIGLIFSTVSIAEKVTLTSLEWPPYTGHSLPEQGAVTAVVREAFRASGYDLRVRFFPWRRTVTMALKEPLYDGYFPEYYAEHLKEDFIFSNPVGTGPLGLAQRLDAPVRWSSLQDLEQHMLGVVSGYVNTPALDEKVANGSILVSEAGDDRTNLLKLGYGRTELAVVDGNVLRYLLRTDPRFIQIRDNLELNERILGEKSLHVAFGNGARGQKLSQALNEGLKKIDVQAILDRHLH